MNTQITRQQIDSYQTDGFVVIEDFLKSEELTQWREAVDEATQKRNGHALPDRKEVEVGVDRTFVNKVFDQLINLWQDNLKMKELMVDERIGRMACELAQVDAIRIWHDQALIKQPWGNPSTLHTDNPYWSFHHPEAITIWVALDDATPHNGCLHFLKGSHRKTNYEPAGFSADMDELFIKYPDLRKLEAVPAPMKAGSCSFHNGLTIHGANANLTPYARRAMTCAFMPDGAVFNGNKNVLTDEQFANLTPGDIMNDNVQNPLLYSRAKVVTKNL